MYMLVLCYCLCVMMTDFPTGKGSSNPTTARPTKMALVRWIQDLGGIRAARLVTVCPGKISSGKGTSVGHLHISHCKHTAHAPVLALAGAPPRRVWVVSVLSSLVLGVTAAVWFHWHVLFWLSSASKAAIWQGGDTLCPEAAWFGMVPQQVYCHALLGTAGFQ